MAEVTTVGTLNGWLKDIYSKAVDLVPAELDLIKELPFEEADAQGGAYKQTVILTDELGFTHAAAGDGAVASNVGVSLETGEATVVGYQTSLEGTIDYESAARATNSKRAYGDIVGRKLANMVVSARKRINGQCWWGQKGLGKIASATAASGGKTTVTITATEFAPYIFAGKKNAKVVVYNDDTAVGNYFTISKVDINAKTLQLTETDSGDAAALVTAVTGAADTLDIYWHSEAQGATLTHKAPLGLMGIAATSTGDLFGLSTDNDLWKPNQYDFGDAKATFAKFLQAAEMLAGRGHTGNIKATVHFRTFANLIDDQAALRRYGGKEVNLTDGAKGIEFIFGSSTLNIAASGWMKAGYCLLRPTEGLKRIGAQDVSFKRPGKSQGNGENIFWDNPSRLGYSYRCYSHQAPFVEEPAKLVYGYGIVNA